MIVITKVFEQNLTKDSSIYLVIPFYGPEEILDELLEHNTFQQEPYDTVQNLDITFFANGYPITFHLQ